MEIQKVISLEKHGEITAVGERQKTELQGTMRSYTLKAFNLAWILDDYYSITMSNQFKTVLCSTVVLKKEEYLFLDAWQNEVS